MALLNTRSRTCSSADRDGATMAVRCWLMTASVTLSRMSSNVDTTPDLRASAVTLASASFCCSISSFSVMLHTDLQHCRKQSKHDTSHPTEARRLSRPKRLVTSSISVMLHTDLQHCRKQSKHDTSHPTEAKSVQVAGNLQLLSHVPHRPADLSSYAIAKQLSIELRTVTVVS